ASGSVRKNEFLGRNVKVTPQNCSEKGSCDDVPRAVHLEMKTTGARLLIARKDRSSRVAGRRNVESRSEDVNLSLVQNQLFRGRHPQKLDCCRCFGPAAALWRCRHYPTLPRCDALTLRHSY